MRGERDIGELLLCGVIDHSASGGPRGRVTKTHPWAVCIEGGTELQDAVGRQCLPPKPIPYNAPSAPGDSVTLWGRLELDDDCRPRLQLCHSMNGKRPYEGVTPAALVLYRDGVAQVQCRQVPRVWMPLATWKTDSAGIIESTLDDAPPGKYW